MLESILIAILKILLDKYLPSYGDITEAITDYAGGKKHNEEVLRKVNEALAHVKTEVDETLSPEEKEAAHEQAFDNFFDALRP